MRGLAPVLAALVLFFLASSLVLVLLAVFKPEMYVVTLLLLGAFAVLVAVLAGPALVKAAGGRRR